MRERFPDRRGIEPPSGFEVMTAADLDPEHGRADRWLYIGRVGRRSCFKNHEECTRAAWVAFDHACAVLAQGPTGAGMRARHEALFDHDGDAAFDDRPPTHVACRCLQRLPDVPESS
jgi:hypothetical protein